MALKFSPAVTNSIASGLGWGDVIKNSVIDVYSGSQPANAGDAATGTKLCRFTTSSGALTAEIRANCRIAFTGGTLAATDTVTVSVGGTPIGIATGVAGTAATLAAAAVASAVNNTWSFPDYKAVVAGTTVGGITYGAVANAANEVFILGPKNAGTTCNALLAMVNTANATAVATQANAAFSINGHTANTTIAFANAAHGGGGTSTNGTGVAAANALTMTYPAVAGKISKSGTWSATASANGVATYFRILGNPNFDDGSTNLNANNTDATFIMRIDGSVGTSGADMLISNTTIAANAVQTVNQFDLTIA